MKYITAFGRFWWDFIVGDSIFLAIGAPVAFIAAYLIDQSKWSTLGEIALPAIVIATLVVSLRGGEH